QPTGLQPTVSAESTPAASPPQLAMGPDEPTPESLLAPYRQDRYAFTARVGSAAARALLAAHAKGVLHRDLKTSNLMLDEHGDVYLVDFGLARLLDPEEGTHPGGIRGTPWYMSPEQAEGGPLDVRSDLFSLGVTLFELCSGMVGPYRVDRRDGDAILRAVRGGRAVPLREVAPDVPERLERVIS